MSETTPGLCACGCGQPTRIAAKSDSRHGYVKGQPVPFLKGHHRRIKVVEAVPQPCECGCGQLAPIAKETNRARGHVRGQPLRFIQGHGTRGKPQSAEHRAKRAVAHRGERSWNWRGDLLGVGGLHRYLCDNFPKSGICEECSKPAKRTEYALIHGRTYSRAREDYRELCRRCHMIYDGQKLEDSARAAIVERRQQGCTYPQIAAEFGVSMATVRRVVTGRR